jgi:hypothetical protein
MYVQCNTEACSRNHCCSGKAISTTYFEHFFADLGFQHAMHTCHTGIYVLNGSTAFFHINSQMAQLSKKVTKYKMCVLIFSTTIVWNISHSKKNCVKYDHKCITGLHVKYLLFLSEFNETCQFLTLRKYNSMKICPVGLCCSMGTDMMKLRVAFSHFVNVPKMKPLGGGGTWQLQKKYESKSMICIYTDFLHHLNKRFSEKSYQGFYITHS